VCGAKLTRKDGIVYDMSHVSSSLANDFATGSG
jgi:hypothetical protein